MIKQIKNKLTKKNKRGFTLIELIVVIAIVAVLAAIGIPAISGQIAKSNQATATSTAKLLGEQASIMIAQQETAGKTLTQIKTAVTAATVKNACGVKDAAFDSAPTITFTDVDENGLDGGTAVSIRVNTVTVVKGGKTGTFVRS